MGAASPQQKPPAHLQIKESVVRVCNQFEALPAMFGIHLRQLAASTPVEHRMTIRSWSCYDQCSAPKHEGLGRYTAAQVATSEMLVKVMQVCVFIKDLHMPNPCT